MACTTFVVYTKNGVNNRKWRTQKKARARIRSSPENESLPQQGPTLAHAGDEGHLPEVADSSRVGIKFVLREGNGWV